MKINIQKKSKHWTSQWKKLTNFFRTEVSKHYQYCKTLLQISRLTKRTSEAWFALLESVRNNCCSKANVYNNKTHVTVKNLKFSSVVLVSASGHSDKSPIPVWVVEIFPYGCYPSSHRSQIASTSDGHPTVFTIMRQIGINSVQPFRCCRLGVWDGTN